MSIFSKQHLLNIDLHTRKKKEKDAEGRNACPQIITAALNLQLKTSFWYIIYIEDPADYQFHGYVTG